MSEQNVNATTPNATGNPVAEEAKFKINIETKESFGDEGIKTEFFTSADLCNKISAVFGEVFCDYVGSKIKINDGRINAVNKYIPVGAPYVELYFKDIEGGDGIKAIRTRTSQNADGKSMDLGKRLNNVIGPRSSFCYTVMKEVYEVLEDFIRPAVPGTKINWGDIFSEVQEGMNQYNFERRELLVCATAISLKALIEEIYGTKSEDGAKLEYEINAVNRIMTYNNTGTDAGYIFAINQLNNNLIAKLNQKLGRTTYNHPYQEYR